MTMLQNPGLEGGPTVTDPRFEDGAGFSAAGKKLAAATAPRYRWNEMQIPQSEWAEATDPFALTPEEVIEQRQANMDHAQRLLTALHDQPGADVVIGKVCEQRDGKKRSVGTCKGFIGDEPKSYKRI